MLVSHFENRWWAVSEKSELHMLLDYSAGLDKAKKKDTEHISSLINISFYVLPPFHNWAAYKKLKIGHKFQKDLCTAFY